MKSHSGCRLVRHPLAVPHYPPGSDIKRKRENMSVPTYVTEDGVTVREGDLVYDYYSMERVVIGEASGSDGWFATLRPGSVTEERPRGVRGTANQLNGQRICTLAFAQRRGFKGA